MDSVSSFLGDVESVVLVGSEGDVLVNLSTPLYVWTGTVVVMGVMKSSSS